MRRLTGLATLTVVVLMATACGRSDDQAATGIPTSAPPAAAGSPTTAAATTGQFGDLKNVCGPDTSGKPLTASDTGVTADSVQISTVSDPGFVGRPGLNQEMFDTATAFSKWCNAQGGIGGRKINLKLRDAKLTNFQQVAIAACQEKDFMMVGGGAVFDDQGQAVRLGCGLPTVAGYVVTPQAASADLTYQPIPNPTKLLSVGDFAWLGKKFPDAVKHTAVMVGSIDTTRLVGRRYSEAVTARGWKIVKNIEYNANGETTWRPDAEALKNAGVKALIWVGEPKFFGDMLKAVSDIGYKLDFARMDANGYDPTLVTEGGNAANGAFVRSVLSPFLTAGDAKDNPATAQYREMIAKYKPGGKIAYLGVQGLSAWLLFAAAATECGADLTRDCVWANIAKVKDWTGGGLHAPQDPADDRPGTCFVAEEVENGKFVVASKAEANQGIYTCSDSYLYHVKMQQPAGAKCPNPAYATDPKPSNCAKS